MTLELTTPSPPQTVLAMIARLTGVDAVPFGGWFTLDLPLRPEPIQVARAEHALVRRGTGPDLRGRMGRVRLEVRPSAGGSTLRAEHTIRLAGTMQPLSEQQRRRLRMELEDVRLALRGAA